MLSCYLATVMQLDLNYVRSFVAVIREGSFAAAARATSLPTSSLSRYISRLEGQAGVRLVERTTRSLRMTEAGRLLYDRARSMVADMADLEASLERHQTTFQGVLTIGVPGELGRRLLGPILARFSAAHPNVECRVILDAVDPIRDDLDLAISFRRGPAPSSSSITKRLLSLPSSVVAAPRLLARTVSPTTTAQLAALPCISTVVALDGSPWRFLNRQGRIVQIPVTPRYRVDSADMAQSAAVEGVGFALLADVTCREAIALGSLRRIQLDLEPAPLDVVAIYPSRYYQIPKAKALLATIRAGIRDGVMAVPARS
ncbi:LysR family transcriptional regulator [soil metagenome]